VAKPNGPSNSCLAQTANGRASECARNLHSSNVWGDVPVRLENRIGEVVSSNDEISIQQVSLDVAVEDSAGNSNSTALGVESCGDCPEGYTGLSCQNAIQGYCRKRPAGFLNNPDELALIGVSDKCDCNSHSTNCDPETCRCLDCEHNTNGDHCQHCMVRFPNSLKFVQAGFYGDATSGPDGCRKCACPTTENSFSPTCMAAPNERGFICDACRLGHHGEVMTECDV
jgi:laminin alpha 1/2